MQGLARCVCTGVLLLSGCQSIGPATIERDQFDYNTAILASQKEQLLANMVRLRYGEAPVFLQVASVIAQYSLEGQVAVSSPGYDRPNNVGPPIAGGAARYTDRPTITYQPLTGNQLASTLLAPISLQAVFSLVQSGWPVHMTLQGTIRTLNGVPASSRQRGLDWNARFLAGIDAIARVSETGAGSIRQSDGRTLYALHPEPAQQNQVEAIEELRRALGLDPAVQEYEIVLSTYRGSPREITLTMASVMDVLNVIAAQFQVPDSHVRLGWTYPTSRAETQDGFAPIRVRAGPSAPVDAFVATFERDHWFWIDESDYASKRGFSFLTMLLTLAESGSGSGPVLTIGAGGP